MDNVTHSLIGVALGQGVIRAFPQLADRPEKKKLVFWTSILANNAPDCDVFLPSIIGGGRLTSLLEHRGYTHTFLASPILAAACLGLAWLLSKKPRLSFKTWAAFFGLGVFGVFCHLGADYCNDYGVHPFSPFLNHWFYGDTLFIVEPLIWFSILPLAFLESKSRPLKGFVFALGAAILGLLFFGTFVPLGVAFSVFAWAVLVFLWQRKLSQSRWNWIPSISSTLMVVLIFAVASSRLHEIMAQVMSENAPEEQIVQLVRTPSPADPFCWKTLIVSEGPGDRYAVREAVVSLLPGIVHATSCARKLEPSHTLQFTPVSFSTASGNAASRVDIHWKGEYVSARSEMGRLDSLYCPFRALRQFARVPFWKAQDNGWFAGDVRYDRSGGGGFSGVHFGFAAGDTPCPSFLPGWDPPVPQ